MSGPRLHDIDHRTAFCVHCGISVVRLVEGMADDDLANCPGGPDTNLRSIVHVIALKRFAKLMGYDRPFKAPPP